jgi:hypothetical protein
MMPIQLAGTTVRAVRSALAVHVAGGDSSSFYNKMMEQMISNTNYRIR